MSSSWLDSWGTSWGDSWGEQVVDPNALRGVSNGTCSVSGLITAKAWLSGYSESVSSVVGTISFVEVENETIAGSGHPFGALISPTGKTKKHRIDDFVSKAMSELYEEITTPKIKKQAAKIVRPFIEEGSKLKTIPSAINIDWAKMERDTERVSALLKLWQEQVSDLEDEEMMLMMMAM